MRRIVEAQDVEARLEQAFRPVRPSRKFVQKVRTRIQLVPSVVIANRLDNPPQWLLLIGGVISVTLLLIAGIRALFYLTNHSRT